MKGRDGIARAALVNVSCGSGLPKILRRSISHLIPIEVEAGKETSTRSAPESEPRNVEIESIPIPVEQETSIRPCRQAAVLGETTRRVWTGHS